MPVYVGNIAESPTGGLPSRTRWKSDSACHTAPAVVFDFVTHIDYIAIAMKTVNLGYLDAARRLRRQPNRNTSRTVRQLHIFLACCVKGSVSRQILADQSGLGDVSTFRLQFQQREILFLVERVALGKQF